MIIYVPMDLSVFKLFRRGRRLKPLRRSWAFTVIALLVVVIITVVATTGVATISLLFLADLLMLWPLLPLIASGLVKASSNAPRLEMRQRTISGLCIKE